MLKSIDSDVDPKLLADEVNKMMPSVMKDLDNIEDKTTYGKEQLLKYIKDHEIMKALAFIDCFEGNTGETLNVYELNFTNDLPYKDGFNTLTDTADTLDTLIPLIGIFFSK